MIIRFGLMLSLGCALLLCQVAYAITVPASVGAHVSRVEYQVDHGQALIELASEPWQPSSALRLPDGVDNLWLKIDITITDPSSNGVFISVLASHQAYWDQQWLGGSGVVGNSRATEQPGYLDSAYRIPDQLVTVGPHTLLLQLSRHHVMALRNSHFIDIAIAPYEQMVGQQLLIGVLPFFLLGGLLVVALFAFSLSFGTRYYRHFFVFGLLCVLVASLMAVESWRPIFSYPYQWHVPRLVGVALLTMAISWLLPWLIWTEFALPQKRRKAWWLLAFYVALLLTIPSFDFSALLMVVSALLVSAAAIIRQQLTRASDFATQGRAADPVSLTTGITRLAAMPVADGLLLASLVICFGLAVTVDEFMESWFFISFGLLMIAILHKLAQQLKLLQQQSYQHQLNNEQLKLSLLKSHIKPHFLMNTLTSLAEWIELEPNTAQRLIEALADEFRLLSEIVDKPLITIDEELSLCQLHLAVMSLRQDQQYSLSIKRSDVGFMIPPGVLHTLVENAISHQPACAKQSITIEIAITVNANEVRVAVHSPFVAQATARGIGTGTGTRYIEARLQSVFNNQFVFAQQQQAGQWLTQIVLPLQREEDLNR